MKEITSHATNSLNLFMALCLTGLLSACATLPDNSAPKPLAPLNTAYDYDLLDSRTQQPISVTALADLLKDSDVVFIGEFHGNQASHLLESQLQNALYQLNPKQILSMEQFERQQQTILDRYLDDEIGETYLINEAPAWENYAGSYRPLIEFAKQRLLPVVAANAPTDIVRCIGRQGGGYVNKLPKEQRSWIADEPFADIADYKQKYQDWIQQVRHLSTKDAKKSYQAQIVRDNTMAESILKALRDNPGYQVIHTNGAFHSNDHLGTVAALHRMAPDLKISVISPIHTDTPQHPQPAPEDFLQGDYIYLLQAQPAKYVDAAYRNKIMKRIFKQADSKPCL
ncbi:ChaN family lipoprotein [Thiomicrorhabdus sp. ZW0627]|uniref:ChaN family lipoprotein n=1 Tax=Thiomicrorhabdus sp. ZW0627 TaxID=3039774 RepID=UPI002436BB5B|nr:ChaN family lipoprotein [Thiomicrorhabdus sp. ZW0627]MDG6774384.1 ChaN family lipoprotein [Thiomicrorhabdus sp. ZW0627]